MTETALKVMVVDDHPIWRDAVARDLADEGFMSWPPPMGWLRRVGGPGWCCLTWW